MSDMTMIHALSTERLQELLHSMGYRVTVSERAGQRQLLSAAQGIGFAVRPGNPAKTEGEFIDYTLSCALRVQGELPAGLTSTWNIGKRFSRLTSQGEFLVLEKDVIITGGVSQNYLRATADLWDRLLQEFVLFLREYVSTNTTPSANHQDDADSASAALPAAKDRAGDEADKAPASAGEAPSPQKTHKANAGAAL